MTGVPVELYKNDGAAGAALGAGIGANIFSSPEQAFEHMHPVQLVEPTTKHLEPAYQDWKTLLEKHLTI
jgi:xylulokinase